MLARRQLRGRIWEGLRRFTNQKSICVTIWHASEAMIPAIPNGTGVWMAVPASPPLRITIRACLDDCCDECRLPVYRCELEGGQMLRLCMSCLRLPN